jgi:hypothetical protein
MIKWMLAVLFALVVYSAGCQKKTISDANSGQPQTSRATPEQQQAKEQQLGQAALGNDIAVSAKIKELAPQFGYSYSEDNAALVGPGTPPQGIKLPTVIGEVKAKLPSDPGAAMQDTYSANTKPATGQTRPEPIKPQSVVGLWRTVREEQGETLTVQHDDKYYEQMSLDANNKMGITIVRDGKVFAQSAFTYRYDPKLGKLTLLSNTGTPTGALMITSYPDHPELLYVREEGNETVKVYENIGGPEAKAGAGGTPPAEGGPTPSAPKQGSK